MKRAPFALVVLVSVCGCGQKLPDPAPAEPPAEIPMAPPNAIGAHAASMTSVAAAPVPSTFSSPEGDLEEPGPLDPDQGAPDSGGVPL